MTRILYVWNHAQTFITEDERLLRHHFDVTSFQWHGGRRSLESHLRLRRAVQGHDIVFTRFAGVHAAAMVSVARKANIPSVVVLGGYDVADLRDPKYGAFSNVVEAPFAKYCLRHATMLLPNDEGLASDALRLVPSVQGRVVVLANGYDADAIPIGSGSRSGVLTVADTASWNRARVKGLDAFVAVANRLPNTPFTIIGPQYGIAKRLESVAGPNVTILPPMPHEDTLAAMRAHKVYAQFSLREGCPNALCEAMLSGASPVGTDVQGVRTVIGDTNRMAPVGDLDGLTQRIKTALEQQNSESGRQRIMDNFSLTSRRDGLRRVVEKLTRSG